MYIRCACICLDLRILAHTLSGNYLNCGLVSLSSPRHSPLVKLIFLKALRVGSVYRNFIIAVCHIKKRLKKNKFAERGRRSNGKKEIGWIFLLHFLDIKMSVKYNSCRVSEIIRSDDSLIKTRTASERESEREWERRGRDNLNRLNFSRNTINFIPSFIFIPKHSWRAKVSIERDRLPHSLLPQLTLSVNVITVQWFGKTDYHCSRTFPQCYTVYWHRNTAKKLLAVYSANYVTKLFYNSGCWRKIC